MTQIIRATHLGFCFGVRDALAAADQLQEPEQTAVFGELVHNRDVNEWLESKKLTTIAEANRDTLPQRPHVMITAHGISDRRRDELLNAGKTLVDTTCPLVQRVHNTARKLSDSNHFVVVIGRPDHVEVLGITEDLQVGRFDVVCEPLDAKSYNANKIGIVCQTTMPDDLAESCREEIARQNPHASIRWINTICRPTRQRQTAVDQLCQQVDLVVVVGGENSNNTRRLTQRCRSHGTVAYQVQSPADLQPAWFRGVDRIGLTAGTSTPDNTIDAVQDRIEKLARLAAGQSNRKSNWSNKDWIRYFLENLDRDPNIPWSDVPTLSREERDAVIESIKIFQLGESGEGKHFIACARTWVDAGGDSDYMEALRLFINEEHQHSTWLASFLQQENTELLTRQWSDRCFRFLRHLAGLRTSIVVLLTAEYLAQVYYLALHRATDSPTLKAICRRVLRDEQSHVIFQQQNADRLTTHWSNLRRRLVGSFERFLLQIAMRVVWYDHRKVFKAAGMSWREFQGRVMRRLQNTRR